MDPMGEKTVENAAREREQRPSDWTAAGGQLSATGAPASGMMGMLLSLQRSAGNAAVSELVQRQPAPAEEDGSKPSGVRSVEDFEPSREDRQAKKAEGAQGSEKESIVPAEGSENPVSEDAHRGVGFVDRGRGGDIRFTDAMLAHFELGSGAPRAFVGGGKTGTKQWAGGGGAGPKGNQKAGSVQNQVPPEYESRMNGPLTNADAWVKEGSGVIDVTRDYVSSTAGDQGNGWWVSDLAAAALERHEQRHVKESKDSYSSKIQPVVDRIKDSATIGKNKTYWQSDARAYLKRMIGWESGIKEFVEADESYNAPGGVVDIQDQGSSAVFPRQRGAGKVKGKEYTNRLLMGAEPEPEQE
jgi:hypothetical protein